MTIQEAMVHAGDLRHFSADVMDEIAEQMPAYLWIDDSWRDNTGKPEYDDAPRGCRMRMVRCGACGEARVDVGRGGRYHVRYTQNDGVVCPFGCGRTLSVKHISKGIKGIEDRLDAYCYRKSAVDKEVIVAIAIHAIRSYRRADAAEPWTQEPILDTMGFAVFDATNRDSLRVQLRGVWGNEDPETTIPEGAYWCWKPCSAMTRLSFGNDGAYVFQRPPRAVMLRSFAAAIRDTPFARAWRHAYFSDGNGSNLDGGVPALDLIARHPCVEYMSKLGMEGIVARKLAGELPSRLIRWNGRDMAQVLGLSKERLAQVKGRREPLTAELLAVLRVADGMGVRCGIQVAEGAAEACRGMGKSVTEDLRAALTRFEPPRRANALKYIARCGRLGRRLIDVNDLWTMTVRSGGDIGSDEVAFPKDFNRVHDRLQARTRALGGIDRLLADDKIARHYDALAEKYGFAFGGLLLRPVASSEELIREGEVLQHCVGTYLKKYAEGGTVICVLRRAVQPDAPFRTVEIDPRDGRVLQDRGWHNDWGKNDLRDDAYRRALELFWQVWAERSDKNYQRVRVSA